MFFFLDIDERINYHDCEIILLIICFSLLDRQLSNLFCYKQEWGHSFFLKKIWFLIKN